MAKQTKKKKLEFKGLPEPTWQAAPEDYANVRLLAELGWPMLQIAEYLGLNSQELVHAFVRDEALKAAYDHGVEDRKEPERKLTWVPRPEDLEIVRGHAAAGLTVKAAAAKMDISFQVLGRRLADTPLLKQAFEAGEGAYQAELQEQYLALRRGRNEDLKYMGSALIFELKARCGFSDRPEMVAVAPVQVSVDHKHTFEAPAPVKVTELQDFAKLEMARAEKENAGKIQMPVIDVEVPR